MADREVADRGRLTVPVSGHKAAHIHIGGIVQGVGFRPFVYGLALEHDLNGWVRNTSAGVVILAEGPGEDIQAFIDDIETKAPPLAVIEAIDWRWEQPEGFRQFSILKSEARPGDFQPISPDVSICQDCRRELYDPADRRYRYPFINCTNCGPRFTIIRDLPYDRPATTMAGFELCDPCRLEYEDPLDRRFHAQPIACPDCGPHVWLEAEGAQTADREQAIQDARRVLAQGGLLAIKGLGGFQLACDATNPDSVTRLRQLKSRQQKPFALMVADLKAAEAICQINETERELLSSVRRPILLLRQIEGIGFSDSIAPGQSTLGLMLPYTPLHELLLERGEDYPEYLIMTSANPPGAPIVYTNEQARQLYQGRIDGLLLHNRPIEQRCDDSVYTIAQEDQYPLRRARGFAPFPVYLAQRQPSVLAVGAELKNTFCLTKDRHAFLSQHIGDLKNYETLQAFEHALDHFQSVFQIQPEAIAYDLHPDYLSTRFAIEYAQEHGLPAIPIQHHHAHIGACLAEHQVPFEQPAIGFSFDGTGYGSDGAIWGGEVLITTADGFERAWHLRSIPMAGGDQAVRQPWRLALAWLRHAGIDWREDLPPVAASNQQERSIVLQQLEQAINAPQTSSMGRLFDAVSSLVGVRHRITYEAQAAMEFEALVDPRAEGSYQLELSDGCIDPKPAIHEIVGDLRRGANSGEIGARFHRGLARAIQNLARQIKSERGIDTVALSGGVWQNQVLLSLTVDLLQESGFDVLIHRRVPANDGGLALGQAWLAGSYLARGYDPAGIARIAAGHAKE